MTAPLRPKDLRLPPFPKIPNFTPIAIVEGFVTEVNESYFVATFMNMELDNDDNIDNVEIYFDEIPVADHNKIRLGLIIRIGIGKVRLADSSIEATHQLDFPKCDIFQQHVDEIFEQIKGYPNFEQELLMRLAKKLNLKPKSNSKFANRR